MTQQKFELPPPLYDLRRLVRSNWHVHTRVSGCASPEMTLPIIVRAAERAGITTIATTDHDHCMEGRFAAILAELRAQRDSLDTPVRVYVGSEISACCSRPFVDRLEAETLPEFRLYALNHYHLLSWIHPEDRSAQGYAAHMIQMLKGIIQSGRADAIAHPLSARYIRPDLDEQLLITEAISDKALLDVMSLAAENRVGWELYTNFVLDDPKFLKRQWQIGIAAGVTFLLGTDAHHLDAVNSVQTLEALTQLLES